MLLALCAFILASLVLLALAFLRARPPHPSGSSHTSRQTSPTPTTTVRLTAPIVVNSSTLYDVESMPAGRWGGSTGGQWVFHFDGRYTSERFDAFVLRRHDGSGSGLHEPVAHFEVG